MKTIIAERSCRKPIAHIMISMIALAACLFSIVTGIVYPIQTYEIELLESWGLWGIQYIGVLIALLISSLLATMAISTIARKALSKRRPSTTKTSEFAEIIISLVLLIFGGITIFYTAYATSGWIIFKTWSFYHGSTVLEFIALFISVGFALGLTLSKTLNTCKMEPK